MLHFARLLKQCKKTLVNQMYNVENETKQLLTCLVNRQEHALFKCLRTIANQNMNNKARKQNKQEAKPNQEAKEASEANETKRN